MEMQQSKMKRNNINIQTQTNNLAQWCDIVSKFDKLQNRSSRTQLFSFCSINECTAYIIMFKIIYSTLFSFLQMQQNRKKKKKHKKQAQKQKCTRSCQFEVQPEFKDVKTAHNSAFAPSMKTQHTSLA